MRISLLSILFALSLGFSQTSFAYDSPVTAEQFIRRFEYQFSMGLQEMLLNLQKWLPRWSSEKKTICGFYADDENGQKKKVVIYVNENGQKSTQQRFFIGATEIHPENIMSIPIEIRQHRNQSGYQQDYLVFSAEGSEVATVCIDQ